MLWIKTDADTTRGMHFCRLTDFAAIITRAQLSLGLADRTHGAHSQPASIIVRL